VTNEEQRVVTAARRVLRDYKIYQSWWDMKGKRLDGRLDWGEQQVKWTSLDHLRDAVAALEASESTESAYTSFDDVVRRLEAVERQLGLNGSF
jgi:hypothetical protein